MSTKFLTPEPPKDDEELEAIIEFYRVSFDFHVDQANKLASTNEFLANLHAVSANEVWGYMMIFQGILKMRQLERRGGQERRDDGGVLWVN